MKFIPFVEETDWPAPEDFGGRAEQDLYKGGIRALFRETATA